MTKLTTFLSSTLIASNFAGLHAFQPSFTRKITFQLGSTLNDPGNSLFDSDPVNKLDLKHAHECADNFGQCTVEEMEMMEKGTHLHRINFTILFTQRCIQFLNILQNNTLHP